MHSMAAPTPRDRAKLRARDIRRELAAQGVAISHAEALERAAAELGYRDWNTASARLSNLPELSLNIGDRITGLYLKQPFTGRVLAVGEIGGGSHFRVTLHLDEAVDVVMFDSFSAFRQRINATIGADGISPSKTGDGEPHLAITGHKHDYA
jgi:Glyoxalase superfamily protein